MSQVFYKGPIARAGTGDVGVIVGFIAAVGLYLVLRRIEKWATKDRSA
jgi:hypothetical protein